MQKLEKRDSVLLIDLGTTTQRPMRTFPTFEVFSFHHQVRHTRLHALGRMIRDNGHGPKRRRESQTLQIQDFFVSEKKPQQCPCTENCSQQASSGFSSGHCRFMSFPFSQRPFPLPSSPANRNTQPNIYFKA